jgi:hypothetical protein
LQLLDPPPMLGHGLFRFAAPGDLLAGGAGQAIGIGRGRVERDQFVVHSQDRVPVLRGGVLADPPLQLLDPSGVHVGEGALEHFEQPASVEAEAAGAQYQGLAACQVGEAGR